MGTKKTAVMRSGDWTFRTFATRCFEAGIDAKTVQNYPGHASIPMAMDLYTHVTEEKAHIE